MLLGNISKHCKTVGVSISSLEKACGLGNGTIGRWDTSSPTVENLKKVADYFGVTIDELLSSPKE